MKSLIFCITLIPGILTSQKLKNSDLNNEAIIHIFGFEDKELNQGLKKFYNCILKNYPEKDRNTIPEITNNKTFNKIKDPKKTLSEHSIFYQSGAANEETRKTLSKTYNKCIKPE